MIVYVIKRSDDKYYTGKGRKTWRGDPSWKDCLRSASLYNEVYLEKALDNVKFLLKDSLFAIKIVKVKIEEVEE